MTFEIEVNGRMRRVSVERAAPTGHQFRVTLDGAHVLVDALEVDHGTLSIVFPERGQENHTVGFAPGVGHGTWTLHLRNGTVTAVVNGRRSRRTAEAGGAGEQQILAPMPGKVLRVLVQPGDEVVARQPLVVIEAMKMENALSAIRPGRVREVVVSPGLSVEAGRLLVVVE
jgi:biotin carboxyl carrier protein